MLKKIRQMLDSSSPTENKNARINSTQAFRAGWTGVSENPDDRHSCSELAERGPMSDRMRTNKAARSTTRSYLTTIIFLVWTNWPAVRR